MPCKVEKIIKYEIVENIEKIVYFKEKKVPRFIK